MKDIATLIKSFERYANGQSLHAAFTDLLDWTLLPFKKYESQEDQVKALETYRTHPKVKQLAPLITLIGNLSEGFSDPLGELYMQALSNGHNGQYFTPEPVCTMLAAMQTGEQGPPDLALCEPSCGSGRMILAAARINRHFEFYAADLDLTCCKMCLVNMLLNSLTGEVAYMNSLSNTFYKGYRTSTILKDGFYHPYYEEFTNPQESYSWLRPTATSKQGFDTPFNPLKSPPINGVQGSLF